MRIRLDSILLIPVILAVLPLAGAHDHGATNVGSNTAGKATIEEHDNTMAMAVSAESYFRHGQHGGWNLAHATFMIVAWTIAMPLAVMLSTAGSRFQIPAQVMFHIINGVGFFTGMVYNHSTPDLYVGNAHHSLGWVVVASTIVWTLLSICVTCGKRRATVRAPEKPSRAQNLEEYGLLNQYEGRLSRDSGHGTERHSESLLASRQNSSDSSHPQFKATTDDLSLSEENDIESKKFTGHSIGFISRTIGRLRTENTLQGARFAQTLLEKILLLLGFVALLSGLIVSGGLFRDREIFSGLAHFIKGGIFFWYGLLTLGRWMGAFTEFGWAWNIRPQPPLVAKWKWRIPSAEFTESFVIWLYGASNVFLEHLNNWGKDWSAQDLEHVSITILFFGGGLLGMLVESDWLRKLINTPIIVQKCDKEEEYQASGPLRTDTDEWSEPQTYRAPMNPMPATVIMLLGMMMGAHHQSSMVSTMMHAQWGGLFTAFGIARATTYVLMYIKPPTSHFAGRPPSELVAAFCLTSGGIIFMNSASDTVAAIEENGLDAMTIFTLTMGLTGVVMTWQIVVFAVRGWAIRRERAAAGRPLSW